MSKRIIRSDYLIKSGVYSAEELNKDTLDLYEEVLNDSKIDEFYKNLIIQFLIPHKISWIKFIFNKEYFDDPFPGILRNDHNDIAPSLKYIKEKWATIYASGYPGWFYIAFPDVALWAIKGDGNNIIKRKFSRLREDDLVENKHFKPEILFKIIELYKKNTNCTLECEIYEI